MKHRRAITFILTLTITVVAVSAIVSYSFISFYNIARNAEIGVCQSVIQAEAMEIENYLTSGIDTVEVTGLILNDLLSHDMIDNNEIRHFLEEVTEGYQEKYNADFTGIYGVFKGEYIDGNGWKPDESYNPYERDWYIEAIKENGEATIVPPYVDAETGKLMTSVSVLLSDNESVLSLDVEFDVIQRMIETIGKDKNGYAFVVDREGMIIAHGNGLPRGTNIFELGRNVEKYKDTADLVSAIYDKTFSAEGVCGEPFSINGSEFLIFSEKVSADWCLVIAMDPSVIFAGEMNVLYVSILLAILLVGVVAYFCISTTLARRKQEENAIALKETAEALKHASVEKSKFLANMSHEIRTPINAVLGMNEMILRESDNSVILGYSENIQSAGKTLLSIVNDVLDFSKIEAGEMSIVPGEYNTMTLLRDSYNVVSKRAQDKGIELRIYNNTMVPVKLMGDETRIRQIITNLMTNAIKYTSEGLVTIEMDFNRTDDDHGELAFSVTDTGIGISNEDKKRLFSQFVRFDEQKNKNIEGTGLGLSITRQLVGLMGGKIAMESEYGMGSKFTAVIPQGIVDDTPMGVFAESAVNKKKVTNTYKESFHAPNAKILVVDDVEMNLEVMKGLLKKTKIQIVTATSSLDAIDMAKATHYDIIFMDHLMPEVDGIEAFHRIRAAENCPNADTPIIVLTGNAVAGAKEEYLREGFANYLSKPVQGEALESMVRNYLPKSKLEWEANAEEQEEKSVTGASELAGERKTGTDTEASRLDAVNGTAGVVKSVAEGADSEKTVTIEKTPDFNPRRAGKNFKRIVSEEKQEEVQKETKKFKEQVKELFFNEDQDLSVWLMNIATMCMVVGGTLGVIASAILGNNLVTLAAAFLCVVLGLFYLFMAGKRKNSTFVTCFVIFMITDIVLPFMYFFAGGMKSGMNIWLFIGLLAPWALTRGAATYILYGSALVVSVSCYLAEFLCPHLVTEHLTDGQMSADLIVGIIIASLIYGIFLNYEGKIFRKQKNRLLEKTEELNESLLEVDKANKAKSEFLANMSHEIRTPIHAILGYSEMIESETKESMTAEYASNVEQAGRNLLSVVGDILDYTGMDSADFELEFLKAETSSAIIDILSYAQYNAQKKSLGVEVSIDPNIPKSILGDAVRYTRVATNLVSNAIKYTDFGKIGITMTYKPLEDTDKGDITFCVTDTGVGMKPDELQRIKDTYLDPHKAANKSAGAEIGLAFATRILQKMGTQIQVESRYGRGSRFWFTIRPHIVDPRPIGEITYTKEMYRVKKDEKLSIVAPEARILAVDDNAMNLDLFGRILADTKMKIDYAENGREAVDMVRSNNYDIIFMDHMMPVMDGIEALKIIRKEHLCDETPIIVLTANAVAGEKKKYLDAGFDEYLSKPVDKQQLLKVISEHLPVSLFESFVTGNTAEGSIIEKELQALDDLETGGEDEQQLSEEDSSFLSQLSFLDTTTGMGYCCDDVGFYKAMLKSYVDNSRANEIIGAYGERNFENYRIFVHAVKGTSLTIGANDLSEHMKSLEFASRDGDIAFVDEHHEEYLKEYLDITEKIKAVL